MAPAETGDGRGVWLVASAALGRTVRVTERYPHIHDCQPLNAAGQPLRIGRRGCAACAEQEQEHTVAVAPHEQPHDD